MSDQSQLDLEQSLHSLICGSLGEQERVRLLMRVVRDENARATLDELIRIQQTARAAYGYDEAEGPIRLSLARFLATREKARPRTDVAAAGTGHVRWLVMGWRVAAAAGIALAIFLGVYNLRSRSSDSVPAVRLAGVAPQELAEYRTIWSQLAASSESDLPWVLMRDGSGRFEYVSSKGAGTGRRGVLLRCLIVSQDGSSTETVNLLLPRGHTVPISLGTVGMVDGRPVRCSVSTSDGRVALDLNVGETLETAVGVRGTACLDARAADIGRFRLDGREFTVWAQTISLAVGEPS